MVKTKVNKVLFLSLWIAEDQKTRCKSFLGFSTSSHASKLAQTKKGHNGPVPALNVIPEPGRNRVKGAFFLQSSFTFKLE